MIQSSDGTARWIDLLQLTQTNIDSGNVRQLRFYSELASTDHASNRITAATTAAAATGMSADIDDDVLPPLLACYDTAEAWNDAAEEPAHARARYADAQYAAALPFELDRECTMEDEDAALAARMQAAPLSPTQADAALAAMLQAGESSADDLAAAQVAILVGQEEADAALAARLQAEEEVEDEEEDAANIALAARLQAEEEVGGASEGLHFLISSDACCREGCDRPRAIEGDRMHDYCSRGCARGESIRLQQLQPSSLHFDAFSFGKGGGKGGGYSGGKSGGGYSGGKGGGGYSGGKGGRGDHRGKGGISFGAQAIQRTVPMPSGGFTLDGHSSPFGSGFSFGGGADPFGGRHYGSDDEDGLDYESLLRLDEGIPRTGTSSSTLSMLPVSTHKCSGAGGTGCGAGSASSGAGRAGESECSAECSVCLEEFKEGDSKRRLPCLHEYHAACIDKWLEGSTKCPVCKTEVQ
jgi:hypothetical protein